ncbi:MAG: T9SS type A sorting domain-containing protein [Bacteroidia bacterium]|nr:T9SS type A sorting domain-containing protein [Bacteroidia bacterium]
MKINKIIKLLFISGLLLPDLLMAQTNIDLFILAGQSNAQGLKGLAQYYPSNPSLDSQIKLYWTNWWANPVTSGNWVSMQTQPGGVNDSLIFGPEVTFSRRLKLNGYNPAIYKCAIPGTNIGSNWGQPGSQDFYDDMVSDLQAAIASLQSQKKIVTIRGLIWIQGEFDSDNQTYAMQYETKLINIINDFRNHFGSNLPILLGVDEQYSGPFINSIIQAQMSIANTLPNVIFTSMYGLQKAPNDGTHLSPEGLEEHGERLYNYYMSMLTNKWENKWSNYGTSQIAGHTVLSTDNFFQGDFDGDGSQELLCIQSLNNNAYAGLYKYQNNDWNWVWDNGGNGKINSLNQGWTILQTDKFYVGKFSNSGRDEILCVQAGNNAYVGLYQFNNGNWQWIWDNPIGSILNLYRSKLTVGDYDHDGYSELFGVSSSDMKMFNFQTNSWVASFTGNSSHPMWPYRSNLKSGDFDGQDGQDDLIGIVSSWATVFYYHNNDNSWNWGESNGGANNVAGWTLPALTSDICLIGNIDNYDLKDELFWLQTGTNAAWATTMNAGNGNFTAGWTTNATPPFIDDWSLANNGGLNSKYLLIKAKINEPEYLMTMRSFNSNYLINMYKTTTPSNYKTQNLEVSKNEDLEYDNLCIFPNPTNGKINFLIKDKGNQLVELFNNQGTLLHKKEYNSELNIQLDISDQPNGIYLIKITNCNDKTTMSKVLLLK